MSGPQKKQLAVVETVIPTLSDKAVTIQSGTVRTSLYSAIYNLFKTGYDAVYTTASAVAIQISNALSGYATESYADFVSGNAVTAANLYTDNIITTKQPLFDYSNTMSGVNEVTDIVSSPGAVCEFTEPIIQDRHSVFTVNSDAIIASSIIIANLKYDGLGYPVILFQTVELGKVKFTVGNLDLVGGSNTNSNIIIEYQIVG